MLTRRGFAACVICSLGGFAATDAGAQNAATTPGLKRKILNQIDGPTEGYVTIIAEAEIDPGFAVAKHIHPGIESTYVIEGGAELLVDGKEPLTLKAGDSFQVAPNTPHLAKNGSAKPAMPRSKASRPSRTSSRS